MKMVQTGMMIKVVVGEQDCWKMTMLLNDDQNRKNSTKDEMMMKILMIVSENLMRRNDDCSKDLLRVQ